MSFPSESDMMLKELQNSDLIYVNLMGDVFKIIVKYRRKIIAKYRHLLPSANRALMFNFEIKSITFYLKPSESCFEECIFLTLIGSFLTIFFFIGQPFSAYINSL